MRTLTAWYGQLVTAAHLNLLSTNAQDAERAMHADNLPSGVASDMGVAQQVSPDLTVVVDTGVARDAAGQRIYVPSPQSVNLAVDSLGSTTAVTTSGNSRIISVYAKFRRNNQTPYLDLNSDAGYEDNLESFEFVVRMGTEGVSPTPPALDNALVLLADVTRAYGATTIVTANIDLTTRRQDAYAVTGTTYTTPVTLRRGKVIDALRDLLGKHNGHVAGSIDKHAAGDITKTISPALADTTTIAAAALGTWLDALVTKLAGSTGGDAVGEGAHGNFAATSVGGQLKELDKTTANDDGAKRVATEAKGSLATATVRGQLDELDVNWGKRSRAGAWSGAQTFDDIAVTSGHHYKLPAALSIVRAQEAPLSCSSGTILSPGAATPAVGAIVNQAVLVPHGATITSIAMRLAPGAHGSSPGTMPTLTLWAIDTTTGGSSVVGSVTDTWGSGAYATAHDLAITGMSHVVDRTKNHYYVSFVNESGVNAIATNVFGARATYTAPNIDDGY